jgi:DNA polymerase-1
MPNQRDRFLILDGHSMIWRALFRRGPPLRSPDGEPTRGIVFFFEMLFALVDKIDPQYFAIAMDAPRDSTWRRKLFDGYKAARDKEEHPKELLIQMRRIKALMGSLGVPVMAAEEFEADDIIASLVHICASDEVECVVASRDTDLHQLVGPNCRVYDSQDDVWIDEAAVEKHWGVPPSLVVDFLTLAGDVSDNVPGVRGIGDGKALVLLRRFGSVAGVMKALGVLTAHQREALASADLDLCRKLVELRRDVPLSVSASELAFDGFDMKSVRASLHKLGIRKWG